MKMEQAIVLLRGGIAFMMKPQNFRAGQPDNPASLSPNSALYHAKHRSRWIIQTISKDGQLFRFTVP
jgi:hypothetical protein